MLRYNTFAVFRSNHIKVKLAAWLSILLDSSVIAVPVFIAVAMVETSEFLPALGWATLALLFANGIPLTYIALGRRFGWVSGFDLPHREERAPFIGWARVHRKRHTWAQVLAGGSVGVPVTWIVLALVY